MKWDGLRLSVTLLTVIPLRGAAAEPEDGARAPDRATVAAAMTWAPAVGLLLGVLAAAVLVAADHPAGAGPLTAAALAVACLALLSRGLHLDGLADLADGLGSGRPAPAALDIMRRSDIGPLGTVTLILTLLTQVAALSQAEAAGDGRGPAALITAAVTSRLALTWACRRGVPAARQDGLGALVAGAVRLAIPVVITLVTVAAAVAAVVISAVVIDEPLGWTLPLAVVAGLAAAFAVQRHAVSRLGGITGDVLGALAEVATAVTLVVAAMGPRALPQCAGQTGTAIFGSARRSAGQCAPAQGRRPPPSAGAPGTSSPSGKEASGSSGRPGAGSAGNPRWPEELRRSRN
jgi:adenosylcobinamide-GDP ribazoletransferase